MQVPALRQNANLLKMKVIRHVNLIKILVIYYYKYYLNILKKNKEYIFNNLFIFK